jgi:hypothetical protein
MSLLDRVVRTLFGARHDPAGVTDQELVQEMVEVIVEAVEPRVRLQKGYRAKLAGGARIAVAHLRDLGRLPLAPIVLSRAAWGVDPYIRSFFSNAAEVTECISRSDEVRRFFEQNPGCNEAHALLGMKCTERQVLAPRVEGGVVRQEVAQTTVSFSEHKLIAPAADEESTRLDVGRRIVERLGQLVLARIVDVEQRAKELAHQQAHLMMKRRLLQGRRDGLQGLMVAPAGIDRQMAELDLALADTTDEYLAAKGSLAMLDGYIDHINAVLEDSGRQVSAKRVPMRLNMMGFRIDAATSDEPANELELTELYIGEGLRAIIALVRIPRDELAPKKDLLAQAERFL